MHVGILLQTTEKTPSMLFNFMEQFNESTVISPCKISMLFATAHRKCAPVLLYNIQKIFPETDTEAEFRTENFISLHLDLGKCLIC